MFLPAVRKKCEEVFIEEERGLLKPNPVNGVNDNPHAARYVFTVIVHYVPR
jgi:hypothetical protein